MIEGRPYMEEIPPEYRVRFVRRIEMKPPPKLAWMSNRIDVGTLNGRWTWTHWLAYEIGSSCAPLDLFSAPYDTEEDAILAAADFVEDYARKAHEWDSKTSDRAGKPMRPMLRAIVEWADELRAAVEQPSLF